MVLVSDQDGIDHVAPYLTHSFRCADQCAQYILSESVPGKAAHEHLPLKHLY